MTAGTSRPTPDEDDRFAFGRNWASFSKELDDERIAGAREGVQRLLQTDDLSGKTFLDIGCGSGLMSLAAHQLGATVRAFDYDPDSVRTTIAVRDRFAGPDAYEVTQGSALDAGFIRSLGQFDIVYSWGVLHHTGDMWSACALAAEAVAPGGALAIAIYNDQGFASRSWKRIKRRYVESGPLGQRALVEATGAYFAARDAIARGMGAVLAARRNDPSLRLQAGRARGMDRRHDLVDWVGGYPFEVAKPEQIFDFYRERGFVLEGLTTCAGGLGCNEFLFRKVDLG